MNAIAHKALAAAIDLASKGIPSFPMWINYAGKKVPTCPRGFYAATANLDALHTLWNCHPGPLVGIPTGSASGLVALDLDLTKRPAAAEWWEGHQGKLPVTRTHQTKSGGLHLIFRDRLGLRCSVDRPALGVDVRAEKGCLVWWPAAGFPVISNEQPAAWPQWLADAVGPVPRPIRPVLCPNVSSSASLARYARGALQSALERIANAPSGSHNSTLNSEAYSIFSGFPTLRTQGVCDALLTASVYSGHPRDRARKTIESALRGGTEHAQ